MWPVFREFKKIRLNADDIEGIQSLYGGERMI
jgi:hypothetical protein